MSTNNGTGLFSRHEPKHHDPQRVDLSRLSRRGFTLLEVLIAAALTVTLLAGLWSLFHVYTRLFETGQVKTERAQLVRALLAQLTDDLHSAIQDPVVPGGNRQTGAGQASARRFGLFGSQNAMRFDVLQVPPSQASSPSVVDGVSETERRPTANAPELRTVSYEFVDPELAEESEVPQLMGLIRRDLDFETPSAEEGGSMRRREEQTDDAEGSSATESGGNNTMVVPEIVAAAFRYFDGRGWSGQWNSLQRKGLPVAVEVVLQVKVQEDRDEDRSTEGKLEDDDGPKSLETDDELPESSGTLTYRLVIDMPNSPLHRAPQPVARTAMSRLKKRASRPAPTSGRPTTPVQTVPLPDQWMRTEP